MATKIRIRFNDEQAEAGVRITPVDAEGKIVGMPEILGPARNAYATVHPHLGRVLTLVGMGFWDVTVGHCDPDSGIVLCLIPVDIEGKVNGGYRAMGPDNAERLVFSHHQSWVIATHRLSAVEMTAPYERGGLPRG